MKFKDIDNIMLFGGARLLADFAAHLKQARMKTVVFSSPRHLEESVADDGTTLAGHLKKLGVPFYSSDDINSDPRVARHLTPGTLGIAMGAAWLFEKPFARRFDGRLLDFMGIRLPEYRGGAHYTWQILADNRRGACNLQVIEGGKDTFHLGPIVKTRDYAFPRACRIPLDYFASAVPQERAFLDQFLKEVRAGRDFKLRRLDESASSHYPFLHTKTQGFIDWSWTAEEIERFIRAFDEPYAGASTFLGRRRLHLKSASLVRTHERFHPFHAGLIYRLHGGGMFLAARGGALRVGRALDEEGRDALAGLRIGDRLTTPAASLDNAMQYSAEYGARGVQRRK